MSDNFQTVTFHYAVEDVPAFETATATLRLIEESAVARFAFVELGRIEEEVHAFIFEDKVYRALAGAWVDQPVFAVAFGDRCNAPFEKAADFRERLEFIQANGVIQDNRIFVNGYVGGYYQNDPYTLPVPNAE